MIFRLTELSLSYDGVSLFFRYKKPQPPYQRLLDSPAIPEATQERLRTEHARLDPFALRKALKSKEELFHCAR